MKSISNVSLADLARERILAAILRKDYTRRLPPEEELAEMLDVSRTTIRSALQSLEQEGVVTRRRALGTTINAHIGPSTLALQRLVGFDGLLEEKGYEVRVEAGWERTVPSQEITEAFGVAADEEVLLTHKVYFADEARAITITDAVCWSDLKRTERLETEIPVSMFEFSRLHFRQPIDHAVVEILSLVHREGNTTLAVAEGDAFTRLHERHHTSDGEMIATSIIDVDNSYIRFEVFRRE